LFGLVFVPAFHRGEAMKVPQLIRRFARDEEGVTAIEYGLIAALIAVVIIASVKLVGTNLVAVFTKVSTELAAAL
jgi:pilus assembly protein Flp/PilA